jgi:cytochrome c-type biogenesis protein
VSISSLVMSGPLVLAIPVAAAAGAVTFLSPCCLPLVPGYLSYVTGMSGTGTAQRAERRAAAGTAAGTAGAGTAPAGAPRLAVADGPAAITEGPAVAAEPAGAAGPAVAVPVPGRGRVVLGTALFVLGFSVLYTSYGLAFGEFGRAVESHQDLVTRVLGAVTVVLGLLFTGLLDRFSLAGRIVRPSLRPRAGLVGAPLLGLMFGIGWSPCVGPTLSAVLVLAFNAGTATRGAFLAFIYCLGLGVPFLVVSVAFQRGMRAFGFARRHARAVTAIGGCMLVAVGLLEVSGEWASVITWMQVHWSNGYNSAL